jgi:lysine 2,3-aminomutase
MKLHPVKEAVVVENDEPPPSAEPPSAISSISDDMLREVSIRLFRKRFFPDITRKTWNDWKWQYASRIRTLSGLSRILSLSPEESSVLRAQGERNPEQLHLPFSVTPYYLSLIDPEDSADPIRRTVIPTLHELRVSEGEFSDPLDEHSDSPVPSIVHRYPDRVLFLVTSSCAAYCRYCTRSRFAGGHTTMMRRHWDTGIEYIRNHTQVRDVIVSGGDPLTLSDEELAYLLDSLYRIPHVEMVRLGTKVPMVMPQRITGDLVKMLRRYKPLYMSIHATHPREITAAVSAACSRLADSGVVLGSQTVLLKGVNDSSDTLKRLFHRLLKIRVRPYYLYQCDPVVGTAQFRTTIDEGKEIMRQLRGFTSGYAVPQYIVDTPGGGGKVPILPDYSAGSDGQNFYFTNYAGDVYAYPKQREESTCS